jgi:hypothetical protein
MQKLPNEHESQRGQDAASPALARFFPSQAIWPW